MIEAVGTCICELVPSLLKKYEVQAETAINSAVTIGLVMAGKDVYNLNYTRWYVWNDNKIMIDDLKTIIYWELFS